ncbi:MAG: TraB/GumN family protein [Candidatus Thiodiazotropha sp. (ex Monitilora ramsayi)]|nr:TraB/GumN family protein [Candidatus Thiodiazotropha sp. (ex Monitilora ramsayi)]
MNTLKYHVLLGILLITLSDVSCSQSPVWKVTNGNNTLFLGGTVHVLSESDYPLPVQFEEAYRQSDSLVFETDIQKLKSTEYQIALLGEVVYTDGKNLQTSLKPDTYQALEEYLTSRNIPLSIINHLKPGMAALTLTMIELQRFGLVGTGVDEHFSARAIRDNKKTEGLESPDQQLAFIKNFGIGYEDELILYTLRDAENLPDIMKNLKNAWRRGDNATLEDLALTPLKGEFPKIHKILIAQRNQAWIEKIEKMLDTPDVEFVLFGALHLLGEEGILRRLESKGHEVKMLE